MERPLAGSLISSPGILPLISVRAADRVKKVFPCEARSARRVRRSPSQVGVSPNAPHQRAMWRLLMESSPPVGVILKSLLSR